MCIYVYIFKYVILASWLSSYCVFCLWWIFSRPWLSVYNLDLFHVKLCKFHHPLSNLFLVFLFLIPSTQFDRCHWFHCYLHSSIRSFLSFESDTVIPWGLSAPGVLSGMFYIRQHGSCFALFISHPSVLLFVAASSDEASCVTVTHTHLKQIFSLTSLLLCALFLLMLYTSPSDIGNNCYGMHKIHRACINLNASSCLSWSLSYF